MWPSDMKGQQNQPVRVFLVDEDSHVRNVISQELMRDPHSSGRAGFQLQRGS
jgi:hypothetical protein